MRPFYNTSREDGLQCTQNTAILTCSPPARTNTNSLRRICRCRRRPDKTRNTRSSTCCEERIIFGQNSLATYFSAWGDAIRTKSLASFSQARRLMGRGSPSSSYFFGSCVCSSIILNNTLCGERGVEGGREGRGERQVVAASLAVIAAPVMTATAPAAAVRSRNQNAEGV